MVDGVLIHICFHVPIFLLSLMHYAVGLHRAITTSVTRDLCHAVLDMLSSSDNFNLGGPMYCTYHLWCKSQYCTISHIHCATSLRSLASCWDEDNLHHYNTRHRKKCACAISWIWKGDLFVWRTQAPSCVYGRSTSTHELCTIIIYQFHSP